MNFLAHLYLSGENEGIRLGNFFADAVKGNQLNRYPEDVKNGIKLHRFIDSYTDNHPIVRQSIKRLQPVYNRYSGIIVDIYYDHFLAVAWEKYSEIPLRKYTQDAYKLLIRNYKLLPDRSRRILPFMITYNWLEGYANQSDLKQVFKGMSRRTRYPDMKNAMQELNDNYTDFQDEFQLFFDQMIREAEANLHRLLQESEN